MGFYGKLVAVLAVLGVLMFWLKNQSDSDSKQPVSAAPPSVATAAVRGAIPEATVIPTTPQPLPYEGRLRQAAEKTKVRITRVHTELNYAIVTVRAADRNHIGDFMDECVRQGMKEVDMDPGKYNQSMVNGRVIYEDTLKMRF